MQPSVLPLHVQPPLGYGVLPGVVWFDWSTCRSGLEVEAEWVRH